MTSSATTRYPSWESDWKITKVTEVKFSGLKFKDFRIEKGSFQRGRFCSRSADCGQTGGQGNIIEGARGEEEGEETI